VLSQPQVHVSGFDRENMLFLDLRGKEDFYLNYVIANNNQSAIVYAVNRKAVDKLYEKLRHKGIVVTGYH
jgi:ATP-dependent DNA helicase RecQ